MTEFIAIIFSNAANVAASLSTLRPGLLRRIVLFHAKLPPAPDELPNLRGFVGGFMKTWIILGMIILLFASSGCEGYKRPRSAHSATIAELEQTYGRLVTASNVPTPDQNGTGDRMGLFRDGDGTFWGIPLSIGDDGGIFGCAPPDLRDAPVSGNLPTNTVEIVGGANQPTPWRGGTGKLELLLRDAQGNLRWHAVEPIETKAEPVCWSQSEPPLPVKHYRLVIAGAVK